MKPDPPKPDPPVTAVAASGVAWESRALEDLANEVTVGHVGPMATEYLSGGVPFLRSQDVLPGRVRTDQLKYIGLGFHEKLRKSVLRPGDVVIVRTGRPGTAAVVPAQLPESNCADLVIVRPGPELVPRFLAYYVNSAAAGYVSAHLVGAVQQHFNVGSAKKLSIPLPPVEEQKRIVDVLGALDEKIDSNCRLAELLDKTAATLFDARFVKFVGVDEFEQCELGPIPRGWHRGSLTDVADFVNGKAFTKLANEAGRPIIRIRELNGGIDASTPTSDVAAGDENTAHFGDILFAWSGSLDVYRWDGSDGLINQHIFKVIPKGFPAWFVYGWIRHHMPGFQAAARDRAVTMGHIRRHHLEDATVSLPDPKAISTADVVLDPIDAQARALIAESITLAEIRDALLPKLISGKVRVHDVANPASAFESTAA